MSSGLTFGLWLKQQRKARGLRQADLAQQVGCAPITLQKIEAGQLRPSHQMAARMAEVLSIPPAQRDSFITFAREGHRANAAATLPFQAPSNLPAPVTPLIGRAQDVAMACQQLLRDDTRLLTLIGPPGVGKTRLALQVAADVREVFEQGIYVVPLASVTDAQLVLPTISHTLGLDASGGRATLERLIDYLVSKQLLLVLDNLEQVISVAPLLARLLTRCPLLKLLGTSRTALRIRAERQFIVPPLALPDRASQSSIVSLAQCAAVALFVDRAQAVAPEFKLTPDNASVIARVCHRLDGLPLALELVAAWMKVWSPAQVLERLDDRLLLSTDGPSDMDDRHRTLRDAIAWSYHLLAPVEQRLFRRLGVFLDGWTWEALRQVCADDTLTSDENVKVNFDDSTHSTLPSAKTVEPTEPSELLTILLSLVNKSLVVQVIRDSDTRFHFLETIRAYALEQLETSSEAEAIRRRHAEYFVKLAEQADIDLRHAVTVTQLNALDVERANFRAALTWSLASGQIELGLRLTGALGSLWEIQGPYEEGRTWLAALLARVPDGPARHSAIYAKALLLSGSLAVSAGERPLARAFYEQSLAIYRVLGDPQQLTLALGYRGALAGFTQDYATCRAIFGELLQTCQALGDQKGVADALQSLGTTAWAEGAMESARGYLHASLEQYRALDDQSGIAEALYILGLVARFEGDYPQAARLTEGSLALARQLSSPTGITRTLTSLGLIALGAGDLDHAKGLLEESLSLGRDHKDPVAMAWALRSLGTTLWRRGDRARALALHRESLPLYRDMGDRWGLAESIEGAALIYCQTGLQHSDLVEDRPLRSQDQPIARRGDVLTLQRGVRLLGAVEALRTITSSPRDVAEISWLQDVLKAARALLGEVMFTQTWAEGRTMTLEQAIAEALADMDEQTCAGYLLNPSA